MQQKFKKALYVFLISSTWLWSSSLVQPVQAVTLMPAAQSEVQNYLQKNAFSGTLLIIRHQRPLWIVNQGFVNFAQQKPTTIRSVYQLASLQKSVTATLVMKAQERHKLRLTNTLAQYYPQIPQAQNITLWNLIRMESGLDTTAQLPPNLRGAQLDHFLQHKLQAIPRYRNVWHYSDYNYVLLARILEKVYHRPYAQIFQREIKRPLHLHHTDVRSNFHRQTEAATAYAYDNYQTGFSQPLKLDERQLHSESGADQLYSTVYEFYRLQAAIVQGKIIRPADVTMLRTPGVASLYNGGVYNVKPEHFFYARGVDQGFDAAFAMADSGKDAVILFSNRHNPHGDNSNKMVQIIYRKVFVQ